VVFVGAIVRPYASILGQQQTPQSERFPVRCDRMTVARDAELISVHLRPKKSSVPGHRRIRFFHPRFIFIFI